MTNREIAQALVEANGLAALAARHLNIPLSVIYRRIDNCRGLRRIQEESRRELCDWAELALRRKVMDGEGWAVRFALEKLGRERGYADEAWAAGAASPLPALPAGVTVQQIVQQVVADADYLEYARAQAVAAASAAPPVDGFAGAADRELPVPSLLTDPAP